MDGKQPTVASLNGIVSAAHPLAALAGVRLLAEGGNAFDAAAATAAALNVVRNLRGSGFSAWVWPVICWVVAERRSIRTLDFAAAAELLPQGRFASV